MIKDKTSFDRSHSLIETSKILNSEQDTDTILNTLLDKSIELVPGGDTGAIFLYNVDNKLLEMRAYKGMGDSVKNMKLNPGESMTGITFKYSKPIFFSNNLEVKKAMGTMSDKNRHLVEKGNVSAEEISSSICCPLMYRGENIGVLVIDNMHSKTPLIEEDVEFLEAISIQATIAIVNAQNYEDQIENNKKLKEYNKIIESQRNLYRYSTETHNKFTDMVLNGSEIVDIIREVKNIINSDIFIIDLFNNVTHHTYNNKSHESLMKILPNIIKYLKNIKTKFYDVEFKIFYHIFPIMINKESMGWLCLESKSSELSDFDLITAGRSSTILALELLKRNELIDLEQSLKGDFIESLIINNDPNYVKKCCERFGYKFEASYMTIIIDFKLLNVERESTDYEKEIKKSLKNYYHIVNKNLKEFCLNYISLIKGHQIIIIYNIFNNENKEKLYLFIQSFNNDCFEFHSNRLIECNYKIGISDVFNSVDKFGQSFSNAKYALKAIETSNNKVNYIYYETLEIKKILMNNPREDLKNYVDKMLGPLIKYKNSSNNEFVETLRIYLKNNSNWTETKNILHIHGNTLTYRLKRVSEILNIDLNNYNDKLRLEIAFEILEFIN